MAVDTEGAALGDYELKLNSYDIGVDIELADAIRRIRFEHPEIGCVVIDSAIEGTFCAGANIKMLQESDPTFKYYFCLHANETLNRLEHTPKLVIAALNGHTVGGGLEIAALCDLRICGEGSRFGVPIKRLGLVMAYPEIDGLNRLVGRAATLEILLEGRVFGAQEAKDKGLVTRVVPDADVEDEVYATAGRIAAGAPLVARWHKRFARRLLDPRPLTEKEVDEGIACFETEDYRIGTRAFLDKKTPLFKGR